MKRTSGQVLNSIQKSIKTLNRKFFDEDNFAVIEEKFHTEILKNLKLGGIPLRVITNIPQNIKEKLNIKEDNVLTYEKVDYGWQDNMPKKQIAIIPLEKSQETKKSPPDLYVGISYIEDGVIHSFQESSMFEVIVYNKEYDNKFSLNKEFSQLIEDFQMENYGLNPNIIQLENFFNSKILSKNVDYDSIELDGNGLLPVTHITLRKADIFYGYVTGDILKWIVMHCIAAGVRCQARRIYFEEAVGRVEPLDRSPTTERFLSQDTNMPFFYSKPLQEKELCKGFNAFSYIVPIKTSRNEIIKKTAKEESFLWCYDRQAFLLKK